jgi:uncharacterized protein
VSHLLHARRLFMAMGAVLATPPVMGESQPSSSPTESAQLATYSARGSVPVKSWKTLRDDRIVKQDLDFSCGAASLATLLNSFYGQNVTEEALLQAIDKGDGRASFEDMARALPQFGFRAQGFAASWEQLTRLKMPVVVYVKNHKQDHFSVLRGISADTVWLADPSLGNRTFSREQFLTLWETRAEANDGLAGKFLAILPVHSNTHVKNDFFSLTPRRHSSPALSALMGGPPRP